MSAIYNGLKKLCNSLGEHNDALYAVLAIAVFKGVMRPTFTMMDKKSDKETKKYAAFREGVTEVIAFASYFLTHKLVLPLAPKIAEKTGKSVKKVKNGLSLVTVCTTAGIIIPAVCNLTLKPIMDGVSKLLNKKNKVDVKPVNKLDIKENVVQENSALNLFPKTYSPVLSDNSKKMLEVLHNSRLQNSGMKVGG